MRRGAVRLEGERGILRTPVPSDAAAIAAWYRRNRAFHAPGPPRPAGFYTEAHWRRAIPRLARSWREDRGIQLFLFLRGEPRRVAGSVSFQNVVRGAFQACHLGYALDREAEGKGLMTEALRLALPFAFGEMGLHRVMANHRPENVRSARVLRRLGFRREGFARSYLRLGGRWRDFVLTSLVRGSGPTAC